MPLNDSLPVVLTGSTPAALGALQAAGKTLEEFGVAYVASIAPLASDPLAAAVIVASPDNALPAALAAATAAPVVRVPATADGAPPTLDLLTCPPADDGGPFATVAIGDAGARNAALLVVSILALRDGRLREAWSAFRQEQTGAVLRLPPPWTPS